MTFDYWIHAPLGAYDLGFCELERGFDPKRTPNAPKTYYQISNWMEQGMEMTNPTCHKAFSLHDICYVDSRSK